LLIIPAYINQLMKNLTKFTGIVAATALMSFASCSSSTEKKDNKDSLATAAKSYEMYLANAKKADSALGKDTTYNSRLALEALKAYTDFTTLFPKDSLTADYLFKAGQLAQSTGNFKQAALFFETVLDQHTGFKDYAAVCMIAAENYHSNLANEPKSAAREKQLYEFLIAKYPDTKYAADAKVLINYIGKSDEELLKDIEKKALQNIK
jgi:outer membrane protein assembly factor BamD (BamD/ComL family)